MRNIPQLFHGTDSGILYPQGRTDYHDRNMERLASGLQYKIRQLKEQAILPKGTDDSIEINAETVHRNMGYCLTGIEAFAEDYGLDVTRTIP